MVEAPGPLPVIALRLAGHVGQTALDRIAGDGAAALAQLDQHISAVRAELGACQRPPVSGARQVGLTAGRASHLAAGPGRPGSAETTCPDVPFVSSALHSQPVVPVPLLLHYACGFIEAAVSSDWRPAESADSRDWASMRLAAICQLISQAQAASELHPDLRAIASAGDRRPGAPHRRRRGGR
jgi:hypothetical protein